MDLHADTYELTAAYQNASYARIVAAGYRIDTREAPKHVTLIRGVYTWEFPNWGAALAFALRLVESQERES